MLGPSLRPTWNQIAQSALRARDVSHQPSHSALIYPLWPQLRTFAGAILFLGEGLALQASGAQDGQGMSDA
jgi:hypothetical protein